MGILPHVRHPLEYRADCECFIRADRESRERAVALGMVPDADAAAADAIRWSLFGPDLPRTYRDEDNPDHWAREWEPPTEDDAEWWAVESSCEGCGPDELSPEEEEVLIWGEDEWVRACKEHARWMEEQESEAAYHEMIGRLMPGGHPSDW